MRPLAKAHRVTASYPVQIRQPLVRFQKTLSHTWLRKRNLGSFLASHLLVYLNRVPCPRVTYNRR